MTVSVMMKIMFRNVTMMGLTVATQCQIIQNARNASVSSLNLDCDANPSAAMQTEYAMTKIIFHGATMMAGIVVSAILPLEPPKIVPCLTSLMMVTAIWRIRIGVACLMVWTAVWLEVFKHEMGFMDAHVR